MYLLRGNGATQQLEQIMSKEQRAMNEEPSVTQVVQTVGVGQYARALIKYASENGKNLSNEQIAAKVVEKFKEHGVDVRTSAAAIAWYKNDMRKKGQLPKGSGQGAKSIVLDIESIEL